MDEFELFMRRMASIGRMYDSGEDFDTSTIEALHNDLDKAGITHTFEENRGGYQIALFEDDVRILSVVQSPMSYGGDEGLLEVMGLDEYYSDTLDEVEGYLTKEEVLRRILDYTQKER